MNNAWLSVVARAWVSHCAAFLVISPLWVVKDYLVAQPYPIHHWLVRVMPIFHGCVIGCIIFFNQKIYAQCPPPPIADIQEIINLNKKINNRGVLFEIKDPKSKKASYLYGSIHVAKAEWLLPGKIVLTAMRSSEVFAFEVDFPQIKEPEYDPTLKNFSKNFIKEINKSFKEICRTDLIKSKFTVQQKLFFLNFLSAQRDGLYPEYAIDFVVHGFAKNNNKKIIYLENVEDQYEKPENLSEKSALDMLNSINNGSTRAKILNLAESWSRGDIGKIENNYKNNIDEKNILKISERNIKMAEKIYSLLQEGDSLFFTIGILHLIGKNGIPERLKSHGIDVRIMEFQN